VFVASANAEKKDDSASGRAPMSRRVFERRRCRRIVAQPLLAVQRCSSTGIGGGIFEVQVERAPFALDSFSHNRFRMTKFEEAKNKSLRMILFAKNLNWKPLPYGPDTLDQAKLSENNRDTAVPIAQSRVLLSPLESHHLPNVENNCPAMISLQKKVGGGGCRRSFRAIHIRLTDILPPDQPLGNRLADPSEEEHS
jgi:hypothetical protein